MKWAQEITWRIRRIHDVCTNQCEIMRLDSCAHTHTHFHSRTRFNTMCQVYKCEIFADLIKIFQFFVIFYALLCVHFVSLSLSLCNILIEKVLVSCRSLHLHRAVHSFSFSFSDSFYIARHKYMKNFAREKESKTKKTLEQKQTKPNGII